ncbi:MAG: serine/threonine-protein kinase [Cyanobacteriota/Melainabacteria group bacterium]
MAISEEKLPEEQPLYGGRYEIKSVESSTLPEGVIEAFDAETRQLVHIKELPEFADSADVEDFLPQAELVARLKHQNLIRVMDFGTTENQIPFLVFEKFQGSNLFEYLQENGRFELKDGLEFCEKAIEGIEYLHSKGVMHGSLSLLNVHPFRELSFMPLNLKISGLLDIYPNEYREYDDSELPIEPFYSPEQLESEEVDFRSDVFSLGCMIYVVVTGKSPDFDRIYQAKNAVDLSDSIKNQKVSVDLEKLIQKCLEFDPEERYQNCAELKEVLESIQKKLSGEKGKEESGTEAIPPEEPLEMEAEQPKIQEIQEIQEDQVDQEESQEEHQAEEQGEYRGEEEEEEEDQEEDAEPESSDRQQPEEEIESAEEGEGDSSIESVDVESSHEEESLPLPDIDSILDTSEPEPELEEEEEEEEEK